ncbi:fatty acid desaturase family protein [Streptomyces wuyuanensis]|uniref:Fatty acid desaturase n=1 Tax=Streptomyces wuyuanensis TaxID=1196353 RepID=A0A1G9MML8_9ACTN|nr:acyl-CoA desaturase [Streptomyces wuyuanensis]SDL75500.1 Fatty acid desaturase [Streptomyces wuyuanensis]
MEPTTTTPASGVTASFEPLRRAVREAGLLAPRPAYYVQKFVTNTALLAGAWTVFFLLGDSWFQLLTAVLLAFAYGQTGLLGHDLGHSQVVPGRLATEVLGLVHGNLLLGFSYGWWMNHHGRHHSHPNHLELDPDILRRVVAFSPEQARKSRGTRAFVIRHQAGLFFPLLTLEAFGLRIASAVAIRRGAVRRPGTEALLMAVHLAAYNAALFLTLPFGLALAFFAVHQGLFGVYLGCVFAPNHKGMPVRDSGEEPGWLARQVLTSRNIRSSRPHDFFYGGLNYQIEHHLFPTMPRPNLRRCRPLTMAYCAEVGLPYHEVSATRSYAEVLRHLRLIGGSAVPDLGRPSPAAP